MKQLLWDNPQTIDYIEKELGKGGVILAEGDTVLGLLADVSENGYAQLDHIKNRSQKPYLILVNSVKKVFNFIDISHHSAIQIEKIMNICWPGPVTLIFKAKTGSFCSWVSSDGTIAIRVPDHFGLLALLSRFDALFSTSANRSGETVAHALEQVDPRILNSVACIVVNGNKQKQSVLPSTIIDCTGDQLRIIREGAFDLDRLKEFF